MLWEQQLVNVIKGEEPVERGGAAVKKILVRQGLRPPACPRLGASETGRRLSIARAAAPESLCLRRSEPIDPGWRTLASGPHHVFGTQSFAAPALISRRAPQALSLPADLPRIAA